MSSHSVRRAFAHRVTSLATELPGALEDNVEALHRSRVASRRLREILPVLALEADAGGSQSPLKPRIRRLTRALGGVRELDVSIGILDELVERHPDLAPALEDVRGGVAHERQALRDAMAAQLDEMGALELPEALGALVDRVGGGPPAERAAMLAARLAGRADRLAAAIVEAGSLYAPERLHAVRIAAKQLRYALELVHEFGGVGTRRLTSRVKRFQDLLGRLHDLEVVQARIRRHGWSSSREDEGRSTRLQGVVDREIRELHAEYLAGAGALRDVVVRCRETIQPRLATALTKRRAGGRR